MINLLIVNYDGGDGGKESCLLTLKTSAINKSDYAAQHQRGLKIKLTNFSIYHSEIFKH